MGMGTYVCSTKIRQLGWGARFLGIGHLSPEQVKKLPLHGD